MNNVVLFPEKEFKIHFTLPEGYISISKNTDMTLQIDNGYGTAWIKSRNMGEAETLLLTTLPDATIGEVL
tara:strand:- start:512 stop:721 length:210 start_codon:yes stop_codon:yes gene_type:complete